MTPTPRRRWLIGVAAAWLFAGDPLPAAQPATTSAIATAAYRGWPGALRLQNGQVEAIIVPEVGRVMSFRFLDGENVFWEDTSLGGQHGDPTGKEWINFGGDKTWPAPEAEWARYTRYKTWMPPPGFDGLPASAKPDGDAVLLTSALDPHYGIRAMRRISLGRNEPTMTITTNYERVSGEPSGIGIWVITQFKDPVAVYVPVARGSRFEHGYFTFRDTPWPQIAATDRWIKVTRDPSASHKLGSDADRLLWVGEKAMCLVSSPRVASATYPDRGASAEVYTNPNPKTYVELELLGPIAQLKPGDRITRTNTYTLLKRTSANADDDARRVLRE